jgi:hypothetical protein
MIRITVEDGNGTNAKFRISGDNFSGYWLEMHMADAQFVDESFLKEMISAINSMTKEA